MPNWRWEHPGANKAIRARVGAAEPIQHRGLSRGPVGRGVRSHGADLFSVDVRQQLGSFSLDVAFDVARSSGVVVLAGASGSGKSSVLRCIAGLARPDAGRISIQDRVLFDHAAGVDVPVHARRVGVVFQDSRLFPHLDVRANLTYGQSHGRRGLVDFDELVQLLGVSHLLERRPRALSGGERQRVAIGRALLSAPELLLMDEPLASLDDERKRELLPFLAALPQRFELPIVYVTHSLGELLQMADEMVVLDNGRVRAHGPLTEALPALRRELASAPATVWEGKLDGGCLRLSPQLCLAVLGLPKGSEGDRLRVRVSADDVTLAVGEVPSMSVRNRLAARVTSVEALSQGQLIHLSLDGALGLTLCARVSEAAARELELVPGAAVTALVKAAGIQVPGLVGT